MFDAATCDLSAKRPFEANADSRSAPIRSKLKRAMDVAGAGVLLLLLIPVFVVVAFCIRMESKGPAFFRQRRRPRLGSEM